MEAELEVLTAEQLLETLSGLKVNLVQVSSQGGRKLEEMKRLTKKVEELKNANGKEKNMPGILKKEDVKTEVTEINLAERKDVVLIFPEEVWTMIFENVPDPKDKWNLTNTCQLFDNILSSWKTGWMLSLALPYIYKDLSGKKLMDCRGVCKSWNVAVDTFLEDHPSNRPHNIQNINPRRLDFVNPITEKGLRGRTIITFRNEDTPSIYEYPLIPKMAGRSPFIGHSIILNLHECKRRSAVEDDEEVVKKLLEKIFNFVKGFGKEIWSLDLQVPFGLSDSVYDHSGIARFLSIDMFQWLPNLRDLSIYWFGGFSPLAPTPYSIPSLAKLETLHVYSDIHGDPLSNVRMKKYHSQLHKIWLHYQSVDHFSNFCRLEWPNLTELQLDFIDELVLVGRLCEVRMPQLSKLVLNMELQIDVINGAGFDYLLEQIRRLCSTTRLDTLRLQGDHLSLKVSQLDAYIQAPHSLKTLEVEHNLQGATVAPSYTFLLLHFPFVENLHLYVKMSTYNIDLLSQEKCLELAVKKGFQEVSEIVEVNKYAYRGKMYRSNIWELFHHLKVFTFQWDVYTRHGYGEYQEKRKRSSASVTVPSVPE